MIDSLAELRKKISIAEIIGEYVRLKKQGANYSGLCPFHAERSPSFSVSETKGVFHCFGCQKGGDVITFLQEIQGISFPEAVRTLASRVGVKLPATFGSSNPSKEEANELFYKLNRFVAQFFHERLFSEAGRQAKEYLLSRGFDEAALKTAYVGYAPAGWSDLHDFLVEKKAPLETAEKLGLIRKKNQDSTGRSYYDLFRDRVMFPVLDRKGRVVAFGGRLLPGSTVEGPKYLNSSESPIFSKGRQLYGVFQAQKHIRADNYCIVVEGYMDCLALSQAGLGNVVATLGTALTETHIKILQRLNPNIVILFDGDEAGMSAQAKAMELLLHQGVIARGLTLPDGLDPDEYILKFGVESLRTLIDRAPYLLDQYILDLKSNAGARPEDRSRALDQILGWISYIPSGTAELLRLQDLSEHFGTPLSLLERRVREMRRPQSAASKAQPSVARVPTPQGKNSEVLPPVDRVDVKFLEHIVKKPQRLLGLEDFEGVMSYLQTPQIRDLAGKIVSQVRDGIDIDSLLFDGVENPELKRAISRALSSSDGGEIDKAEWEDLLKHLKRRTLESQRDVIKREIKNADALGNANKVLELMSEFNRIQKNLDQELKGGQFSL